MNTRDQILEYVKQKTQSIKNDDFSLLTTASIAQVLHLSRSSVSQNLNILHKEGILSKISTRPVIYFDMSTFERINEIENIENEYLSIEELLKSISKQKNQDVFADVIGYEGSLQQVIHQVKSALMYPGSNIPLLLVGKKGSGKSYLVSLIYQFLIQEDQLNVKNTLEKIKYLDENSFEENLFGNVKESGLLLQKDLGIVYIENLNAIPSKIQYKLAKIIEDGYFTLNQKTVPVNARFIFGAEDISDIEYTLSQKLPITAQIPKFDDRGMEDKEKFIIRFFKNEQQNLNKKIYVSTRLVEMLLQTKFDQDIHQLEKTVTQICASSLAQNHKEDRLDCYIYHLPDSKLKPSLMNRKEEKTDQLIAVDDYIFNDAIDKIIQVFANILNRFKNYQDNIHDVNEMFDFINKDVRQYYDLIIYNESFNESKQKLMESIIDETLKVVKNQYNVNLSGNYAYVLSRILISTTKSSGKINNWIKKNQEAINSMYAFLKRELYQYQLIAEEISNLLYQKIELRMDKIDLIFLILNLNFYNTDLKGKDMGAIIVSHGYSTASSIADAVNQLLTKQMFDAFDMPLDSSATEIVKKINDYINVNLHLKDLIIMVDMGSLESIGDQIVGDVNLGIINNISTSIALNIGTKMSQDKEMEVILEEASKDAITSYKIIKKETKEKAILFVSDAGSNVSSRMVNLFNQSLPKNIDLMTLSYDYKRLVLNGSEDEIFKKYNVLLLVKPQALKVERVNSVSLEEMINYTDISVVNTALKHYLNRDEIEVFNHNIIKNFSLENVMENLTILNPNKLLDFISEDITTLQRKLGKKFQNKTIIGMYIHVSFLIERLVTKSEIDNFNIDKDFSTKHKTFIDCVKESFESTMKHYNVEMPIGEIALLYDYIANDEVLSTEEDFSNET